MSTEDAPVAEPLSPSAPKPPPTEPAAMATANKRRPKLDLSEPQKRKRGGMFGLLLGTLNKAKIEDKERSASEAAKKRQLIDQRLQNKLRKETDSVRRAEEARKDKLNANRKEEDLQLKDSIYKLRRTRLPLLANFLLTSDIIPASATEEDPAPLPLALSTVPRGHPPPLYYLPAVLTPAQESYIKRRKAQVLEAVDKEYTAFLEERAAGITEILELRKAVAEEEARKKSERDAEMETQTRAPKSAGDVEMDIDDGDRDSATLGTAASNKELAEEEEMKKEKEEPLVVPADGDDAVEY
ncbi:Pinin-SDK-memA domain-containing protein [Mycena sanguinolenta]|uniref:Pinin-SDK-memA domain-containing protein n=1 Tax=Mycena sanguinolenta TaxID=230812 RepID=A0A8H6Z4R3_9AGAR|nr:Pinin-SDK-memA domain-containing protein [Mycena sanguinolenta]